MTSITWTSPRYVQELATILGPQNRTQGSCGVNEESWLGYLASQDLRTPRTPPHIYHILRNQQQQATALDNNQAQHSELGISVTIVTYLYF